MTAQLFILTISLIIMVFAVVIWYLESRRNAFVKTLTPGSLVRFQFENYILIGKITEKHERGFVIKAGERTYCIANDRIIDH